MMFFLLSSVIFVLSAFMFWRKVAKRVNEPPTFQGAWPVIGHSLSMLGGERFWKFSMEIAAITPHQDGVSTMLVGPAKVYVVCNPNDMVTVANQCFDKSDYYEFSTEWIGNGLLVSKGYIWKKDRKILMPAFSHHMLEGFLKTLNRDARKLVEIFSAKAGEGSFDHLPYIDEYAIDSLCNTVMEIDISKKQEYIHATQTVMKIMATRFLNVFLHSDFIYKWTNYKKIEDKCNAVIHSVADEVIRKEKNKTKLKEKCETSVGKKNFLEILLETTAGENMSDKELRDHVNLMIAAGFDTKAVTMSIILMILGEHKDVQEKIYIEINEVLSTPSKDIDNMSDLDQLVYLEAVIKEVLRLYPPGLWVARELRKDIKLEKYTLYAGHTCALFLYGQNVHPMWGPDAQQFRPERWLDPAALPDHPAAFAAFSVGKRSCIAKYYAMISLKIFLVHMIRNFIITADCSKIKFSADILARMVSGQNISLQRRA